MTFARHLIASTGSRRRRPAATGIDDGTLMTDNRNTILAVILSGLVLIAWQYFYNVPQMEKQRAETQRQAELQKPTPQATPGTTPQAGSVPAPAGTATTQPASTAPVISREAALE